MSVTAASVQDRDGDYPAMAIGMEKYAGISTVFVDVGYARRCAQTIHQQHDDAVEVVRHPANANGFTVLPKRWVVEQIHAWIEKARRLVIRHDRHVEALGAWVRLAAGR